VVRGEVYLLHRALVLINSFTNLSQTLNETRTTNYWQIKDRRFNGKKTNHHNDQWTMTPKLPVILVQYWSCHILLLYTCVMDWVRSSSQEYEGSLNKQELGKRNKFGNVQTRCTGSLPDFERCIPSMTKSYRQWATLPDWTLTFPSPTMISQSHRQTKWQKRSASAAVPKQVGTEGPLRPSQKNWKG
jgi:hypothetical protein